MKISKKILLLLVSTVTLSLLIVAVGAVFAASTDLTSSNASSIISNGESDSSNADSSLSSSSSVTSESGSNQSAPSNLSDSKTVTPPIKKVVPNGNPINPGNKPPKFRNQPPIFIGAFKTLTTEQKADVYALSDNVQASQFAILDKLAQLKVFDTAMVTQVKAKMTEVYAKEKTEGLLPIRLIPLPPKGPAPMQQNGGCVPPNQKPPLNGSVPPNQMPPESGSTQENPEMLPQNQPPKFIEAFKSLSADQKADVYALCDTVQTSQIALLDKLAQLKVLDSAMVTQIKAKIAEVYAKEKTEGLLPIRLTPLPPMGPAPIPTKCGCVPPNQKPPLNGGFVPPYQNPPQSGCPCFPNNNDSQSPA